MRQFPPYDPTIQRFDPEILRVDAETLQFKSGADHLGVTGILRGISHWMSALAGTTVVWERNNGFLYIADGHQRRERAVALQHDVDGTPIKLNGFCLRESDGWTANDVRFFCALKNIAEGGESTKPIDVARLIRSGAQIEDFAGIVAPSRLCYQYGVGLAKLADPVFSIFLNEVAGYRIEWGVAIGNGLPDKNQHMNALNLVRRYNPTSDHELSLLIDESNGSDNFVAIGQSSLFDDDAFDGNSIHLIEGRVKIMGYLSSSLRQDRGTLASLSQLQVRFERLATYLQVDRASSVISDEKERLNQLDLALRHLITTEPQINQALSLHARRLIELTGGDIHAQSARKHLASVASSFVTVLECRPEFQALAQYRTHAETAIPEESPLFAARSASLKF